MGEAMAEQGPESVEHEPSEAGTAEGQTVKDTIKPVAVIQQYALKMIRELGQSPKGANAVKQKQALENLVIKSMAICVNAMRNSV